MIPPVVLSIACTLSVVGTPVIMWHFGCVPLSVVINQAALPASRMGIKVEVSYVEAADIDADTDPMYFDPARRRRRRQKSDETPVLCIMSNSVVTRALL
ncbi:hypothetical protein PROFUN_05494 [Planoprotostelium fungivorum]|uniref:Uncharacterized protein n=1 Tax=Planoprotostelium fungivorum TaxID=1890364 RepID=A0A2P6NQW7_9EUKA|nr:hypothetical protein PROFUN_05494 [Planoprotostelium fungivorum]